MNLKEALIRRLPHIASSVVVPALFGAFEGQALVEGVPALSVFMGAAGIGANIILTEVHAVRMREESQLLARGLYFAGSFLIQQGVTVLTLGAKMNNQEYMRAGMYASGFGLLMILGAEIIGI